MVWGGFTSADFRTSLLSVPLIETVGTVLFLNEYRYCSPHEFDCHCETYILSYTMVKAFG